MNRETELRETLALAYGTLAQVQYEYDVPVSNVLEEIRAVLMKTAPSVQQSAEEPDATDPPTRANQGEDA